jgi:hypothetical protein
MSMDIITNSSIELAALRQQLSDAWSEHPFPVDKVAKLNIDLRDALVKFTQKVDLRRRAPPTPKELAERRERRRDYLKAYKANRDTYHKEII